MVHKIVLLPGDGIGPEVTKAMQTCVSATGLDIKWETFPVGEHAIKEFGTPLPEHVVGAIKKAKVAIKGPISTPIGTGFRSINVLLRQSLDLFACVRPAKYYEGTKSIAKNVDILIFRENTEDLYAGIEFEKGSKDAKKVIKTINGLQKRQIRPDSGISIKPISVFGTKRLVKHALDHAVRTKRKKATIVHKANIMKFTDGLFLKIAREVAEEYKRKIEVEDCIVDNLCMQLVQRPEYYDVLILPNLYGDIVSDLCAGLVGGLGIAPGANIGAKAALFEPVHGSAPKYAGLNKVNPTATILSAVLMLRYINEIKAADRLEEAVKKVIKEGKYVTYDLKKKGDKGEPVGTQQMAEAICRKL